MLEIGKSYTIEQVVTPEMTARAIGSGGLEVFEIGRASCRERVFGYV